MFRRTRVSLIELHLSRILLVAARAASSILRLIKNQYQIIETIVLRRRARQVLLLCFQPNIVPRFSYLHLNLKGIMQ